MALIAFSKFKPNLLCIAPPPFSPTAPPAGAAYLLGYLKSKGCHDFDFLDLRLGVPDCYSPTYSYTGAYAEAYVHDIPDLPLVLQLITAFERGESLAPQKSGLLERFCIERGISLRYLLTYLSGLNKHFTRAFEQLPDIKFIGFTVWTTNYLATLLAAAHLKRRRKPPFILAGGPQVTLSTASMELGLRSKLFDMVATGEGEETLLEVYSAFARDGHVAPGIAGTIAATPSGALLRTPRPLLRLGDLPTPSFAEMHIDAYQTDNNTRSMPLQFSRGCTDQCKFCNEWKFWERYRTDSAEHLVGQIEQLKYDYGANHIIFMDSLLNGVPKRLIEFCELLKKRSVKIEWSSFMRANMDAKTAKLLKQAGCNSVFVGVESFSDETLELMRKRRNSAHNLQALEAFLEAGICVTAGFVPGFPGDTRSSFVDSAMILRDLQEKYSALFDVQNEAFVVQPGSPIFSKLDDMGLSGKYWAEDYLDIAPAYRDITRHIYCSVEGNNQGLERVGRLSTLRTLIDTEQASAGFAFVRAEAETILTTCFSYTHILGGWSIARRKSQFGHIYSLIVTPDEQEELDNLGRHPDWEESPSASRLLARLERSHLIPPSRNGLPMVKGIYRRKTGKDCRYAASPFFVARAMDWRHKNKVLFAHSIAERVIQKPGKIANLLRYVSKLPRSDDQLVRHIQSQGITSQTKIRPLIEQLKEEGVIVTCDCAENQSPSKDNAAPLSAGPV
ncbi:MAG: B12-binding domain-containing radical SAM protein [Alphaproteobacteria bacterium]|nr:B12-binding domain-containing radical SAM protein [Alphaproteobacteria bacterium]